MRYSRHFYDLYQLINHGVGNDALNHLDILVKVIYFKEKFYPCLWARYGDILKGICRLIPNDQAIEAFSKDYKKMEGMIYGVYPDFKDIISTLKKYENILNTKILGKAMIVLKNEDPLTTFIK